MIDTATFGARLDAAARARQSVVCVGLDPDLARLPEAVWHGVRSGPAGTARAVERFCNGIIEAVAEHAVAIKPQLAFFEAIGPPALSALERICESARAAGLLVVLDGKRGDIGSTSAAYASAYLAPGVEGSGPRGDALTVNPYLGDDGLEPFVATSRAHGRGLFVLVRTSNPGAADVQDQQLSGGGTVSGRLAALVAELGAGGIGRAGISDVGAVTGATVPGMLPALREAMPNAPFLLPGVGAQGGRVEDLAPAFAPGPAGGLVSASRGIVQAYEQLGGKPEEAARAEASRLRELAWGLTR
jgi:orotidine-5'-phosphate decarboxylase